MALERWAYGAALEEVEMGDARRIDEHIRANRVGVKVKLQSRFSVGSCTPGRRVGRVVVDLDSNGFAEDKNPVGPAHQGGADVSPLNVEAGNSLAC